MIESEARDLTYSNMRSPISTTLIALSTLLSPASSQNSGTFSVLSFNVAGLPAILNSNGISGSKSDNHFRVGQLFAEYDFDLIQVQEDFNYHAYLYRGDENGAGEGNGHHAYRTPTSGPVPVGDGLNTLSKFAYTGFERMKWDKCSVIEAADCFTPKGFTYMRVRVADGVEVDAYNIHMDAGSSAADKRARESNIRQVIAYMNTHSANRAVLIFGDSNSLYTRAGDKPELFRTEAGMTDAWIELVQNGVEPADNDAAHAECTQNPAESLECEILDKVWYRSGNGVNLQATSFEYVGDMFLQEDGSILSDHNPVRAEFAWSKTA